MKRNRKTQIAVLTLLIGCAISSIATATIQSKVKIGKLSCKGWQLSEKDGQLGLAQVESGKWYVSAPILIDSKGRFVSGDPDGKSPTLHLVKEKNAHINWSFEFSKEWEPRVNNSIENSGLRTGTSGFNFRMILADGPFKGMYVAVDPIPPEAKNDPTKVPFWRPLKLSSDAKDAVDFEYQDTKYEEGLK